MTQVVRWLALGILALTLKPSTLPASPSASECIPAEDPKNGFSARAQLCQPFVASQNPQVVRVISLMALPGPRETVKIQAQVCTGVVIGPRTVLTAKHCFEDDSGGVGKVIAGFVKTLTGDMHPIRLRSPAPREDIMMLTVAETMGIEPAVIAPKEGLNGELSLQGYGCLYESLEFPFKSSGPPLQRAAIARYVIDNTLYMSGCVCHGDSGGPVFDGEGRLVALMIQTDNQGLAGRGLLVHNFLNAP